MRIFFGGQVGSLAAAAVAGAGATKTGPRWNDFTTILPPMASQTPVLFRKCRDFVVDFSDTRFPDSPERTLSKKEDQE